MSLSTSKLIVQLIAPALLSTSIALLSSGPVRADTAMGTALKIQVRSLDAKFIGTGVGELNAQVVDTATGRVLDQGRVSGPTGDTESMMREGQTRGFTPSAERSASWTAQLDIDRPTLVQVTVTGPLSVADSVQQQSLTLWMLPGVDRVDPPLVLQQPGLIVDTVALDTSAESRIELTTAVTMLCGCPITADGLWRADDFAVAAALYRDGELISEAELDFTGTTNQFAGGLERPEAGDYTLYLTAHQRATANTGVQQRSLSLR